MQYDMRTWMTLCEGIFKAGAAVQGARWWGNLQTGQTVAVPEAEGFDTFFLSHLDGFIEAEAPSRAAPDFQRQVKSLLVVAALLGWVMVEYDVPTKTLSVTGPRVPDEGSVGKLVRKLMRRVDVQQVTVSLDDQHDTYTGDQIARLG